MWVAGGAVLPRFLRTEKPQEAEHSHIQGDGRTRLWAPRTVGTENRCAPKTPLTGRKDLVGLWGGRECQERVLGRNASSARSSLHRGTFGWRLPDHLLVTFLREFLPQAEAG